MLIFVSIALGAFVLVAGSFLFGSDHDGAGDHDASHDLGGDNEPTISIFSTKVIATLLMGFGAAGAIAEYYKPGNYLRSSLIGVLCGVLLGAVMYAVLGFFFKQQASSLVDTQSAVGCSGTVTVSIGEAAAGEVSLQVDGLYCTYMAKTRDGRPIPKGQTVRVVQTMGSQLLVEKE